jgi:16S rRNA (guanine527-N7)-methyltransferase
VSVFEDARRLGFLGPRPVEEQIEHAAALTSVLQAVLEAVGSGPAGFLDLGSGGGLPGLVLAAAWPDQPATLLDSSRRRTAFLRRTVAALGWDSRVAVAEGRAETLARDTGLRSAFPLVVARSFGPPGVTAEIGGAFLAVGGRLAVSEPSAEGCGSDRSAERWPPDGLAELGLAPADLHEGAGAHVAVIRRVGELADRWPRGVGIPSKRPVW